MAKRRKPRYDDLSYKGYTVPKQKDIDKIAPFISGINPLIAEEEARRNASRFDGSSGAYGSYSSFKDETVQLTRQLRREVLSKKSINDFKRTIDYLDANINSFSANQIKAVRRLKRAEKTISSFKVTSTSVTNDRSMARLMKGMEEYIAATATLLGTSKNTSTKAVYDPQIYKMMLDTSEKISNYGKIIFGSGRGFKLQGEGAEYLNNWYDSVARLNTIQAIKSADYNIKHRIDYEDLRAQGIDIVLLAYTAATEHISVHDAMAYAVYRAQLQYIEAPGEITHEEFVKWSRAGKKLLIDRMPVDDDLKQMALWAKNAKWLFDTPSPPKVDDDETEPVINPLWDSMKKLVNFDTFERAIAVLTKGVLDPLHAFVQGMQNISSGTLSVLDFVDFMNLPWKAVLAVWSMLNGATSLVLQSTKGLIDISSSLIRYSAGTLSEDEDEDDVDVSDSKSKSAFDTLAKVAKAILAVIQVIFKAMSIGFTLVSTFIRFGILMFLDIFRLSMKLLKEILHTSPVYEAIANIFNLAISMFFLPFFMSFGNALLDTVFDLLIWARDKGQEFITTYYDSFQELAKELDAIYEGNKEWIADTITALTTYLVNVLSEISGPLTTFTLGMSEIIIDKHEEISNFALKGIDVATAFLKGKIMEVFLHYGYLAMEFISNHRQSVMRTLKKGMDFVQTALDLITPAIKHLLLFSIAIGSIIGAMVSAIGYLSWNKAWVEMGIKIFGMKFIPELLEQVLKKYLIGGASFGALLGAAVYFYLFGFEDIRFGKGGYIPPTPGGLLATVAETETEYIIPESKIHLVRGHNNMVINFNEDVYLLDDPMSEVASIVNGIGRQAYYR